MDSNRIRSLMDRVNAEAGFTALVNEIECRWFAELVLATNKPALEAAEAALEALRRGHGVEVSAACYPALNLVRDALGR